MYLVDLALMSEQSTRVVYEAIQQLGPRYATTWTEICSNSAVLVTISVCSTIVTPSPAQWQVDPRYTGCPLPLALVQ
jgi:hypothetical protein